VIVAGAGMAGLCAAARARELGLRPVVLEKGDRPGGSMLVSSCVVWRYRTLEAFRSECPHGDPELQAVIVERLDEGLEWLETLGAPVVTRDTGNPRTSGVRFEPRGLTEALVRAGGDVRLGRSLAGAVEEPLVLATGGFPVELARRLGLLLRSNPWSAGDGLRYARERGAATAGDLDEFYGRNMPAPPARVPDDRFVELAQLYGRHALVLNERGERFTSGPPSWSEIELVQATARQPGGRAWYVVDAAVLGERVRERTVAEMIEAAEAAGGTVRRSADVAGLGLPIDASELATPPFTAVHVGAAVTHTLGGLRVDRSARVLREDGAAIEGLYAAGVDAGGIASGGYASGLAQALVLGLAAAEDIARG
jgi:fumarate reductase flavoprotein subunit